MEKTLVLLKPDSIARGLTGKIISRFEERGLTICALKLIKMEIYQAEELYKPHLGKPFYPPLLKYMTSGPIVAIIICGDKIVDIVRTMMGATNPVNAAPGSIRGDFAQRMDFNCIHGSDSPESAAREIPIFFKPAEILDYKNSAADWV